MAAEAGDEGGQCVAEEQIVVGQLEVDFASAGLVSFQQRPSTAKQPAGTSGLGHSHCRYRQEEVVVLEKSHSEFPGWLVV